jgi:hypothetical protein
MEPTSLEWRRSAILAGESTPAGEVRESGADERPGDGTQAKDHKMVMIKEERSAWDRLPPNGPDAQLRRTPLTGSVEAQAPVARLYHGPTLSSGAASAAARCWAASSLPQVN